MKCVAQLPLAEITPGMRLAAPVQDAGGTVLMQAGVTLSESMLNSLARREIAVLSVEYEVEEDTVRREARLAEIRDRVQHRFRKVGDSAEAQSLYQAILEYEMEREG